MSYEQGFKLAYIDFPDPPIDHEYVAGLKPASFEINGTFDCAEEVPTTFQVDAQYRRCPTCQQALILRAEQHATLFVDPDGTRCVTPHREDCPTLLDLDTG